jgi:hypothetical protein
MIPGKPCGMIAVGVYRGVPAAIDHQAKIYGYPCTHRDVPCALKSPL